MAKYIFVGGGVMSSVGKGITTASIGKVLQSKGYTVTAIKIDPYINVDAGTMNPIEHGEVFVTDDGTECDQDIGNYERFLDINLSKDNCLTTGSVYLSVIKKERNLEFQGRCVEVVPDIPNEVIARIKKVEEKTNADFVLIEIGGTVGEYQNMLFLETARIMKLQEPKNVLFALVSYLPIPSVVGEMKTKPTQTAAKMLNEAGIQPDFIFGRSSKPLDELRKRKISVFCNLRQEDIISSPDVETIYEIPINFDDQGLGDRILEKFGIEQRSRNLEDWRGLVNKIKINTEEVKIGILNKNLEAGEFNLSDSYISLIEAIKHASWYHNVKPKIEWLSSSKYENEQELEKLKEFDAIIMPGIFGKKEIGGEIKAIEYIRKNNIPFLGLCLGLQLSVIEYAKNVCGIKDTSSLLTDVQISLGAFCCNIKEGTKAFKIYEKTDIQERHRHKLEVNNEWKDILEQKGLIFSGINKEKNIIEMIELENHPYFIACQFHPQLKSRPLNPHPLFKELIKVAKNK
ncbi:MAG: CTP synthase [Minisyncoccales bacterium]|jgi:CTP synthase